MAARIITLAVLVAFTAANLAAAPVPKGNKTAAEKLEGRWQLMKSNSKAPLAPHYVTFAKDGSMVLEVGSSDPPVKYTGKFTATDDAIDYELKMNVVKSEKLAIKSLTADDLKTTDPDGIEEEFKRVKE